MTATLHLGDCADVLTTFPPESIDLTVTSPPYDNLRTYKGYTFVFEPIAVELYRVTKPGGVVVWVVGDETVGGSETTTSFQQALYFTWRAGFNLLDTMIYQKIGGGAVGSNLSYWQSFEYMFVFSKGLPKTVNRLKDRPNKYSGHAIHKSIGGRSPKYAKKSESKYIVGEFGYRTNIWQYHGAMGSDRTEHPAPFPEALANDHILSWSNPGDTVLDPMMGSGTTGKMAVLNGRNFIGIEIAADYMEIAQKRIAAAEAQMVMSL